MIYTAIFIKRITLLAISIVSLTACTSSLVLGTAYNAAAERMADRVKTFAEFDKEQKQWIEKSFQSFQQWHRVSELPAYSAILNEVATTLQSDQPVAKTQLVQWFDTMQKRATRARACSPLSGAAEFLSGMPDWQVKQLERKLKSNRLEQFERYNNESTDARRERRRERMITWASRAGVKLTEQQKTLLDQTLSQQTSMGDRRFQLWNNWTSEFITLLETRDSEQFPEKLRTHIDSLWNITERNYPEEWRQNKDLWQNFAHTLINNFSLAQKKTLAERITSIADSATSLSRKKSRATPICYNE